MNEATQIMLARESAGYSQEQLSRLAGLGRSRVDRIENGRVTPKPETLAAIWKVLRDGPQATDHARSGKKGASK